MVEKKNILFLNATYSEKIKTLQTAKRLGLTVSVVGPDLPEWSKPYVDHYIKANTYDIDETLDKVKKANKEIPFDGVITFWDRDVVPVAVVAKELNLKGSPIEAAEGARNKGKMREVLKKHNVPHPKFTKFHNFDELYDTSIDMEYPLIVKPVGASASKGVFKINSPDELYDIYGLLISSTSVEKDKMFTFYKNEYLVEEFMEGNEVSVEGVVSDGNVYFAGITEKWTDEFFNEPQFAFPARVSNEIESDILDVTRRGIKALGLDNCGFHAELMITESGSKIVEINGRLGGGGITTDLVPIASGIDITAVNLLVTLGERFDFTPKKNKGSCAKTLMAKQSGVVDHWEGVEEIRDMPGVVDFIFLKNPGDSVGMPPEVFNDCYLGYVITEGEDTDKAIEYAENALAEVKCVFEEEKVSIFGK
ncbi:ATP-grasp domain-containing protein [Abyssisolibacter fermentans]|uniref:ATP-grasp domain-containing protein n=1 Tax=Abyssisolibacter fermentans TaxID=1766203 RepID=UPI000832DF00|nr:ATP-grasp domain-containing protein [Abyssisolibacter fermentans]